MLQLIFQRCQFPDETLPLGTLLLLVGRDIADGSVEIVNGTGLSFHEPIILFVFRKVKKKLTTMTGHRSRAETEAKLVSSDVVY